MDRFVNAAGVFVEVSNSAKRLMMVKNALEAWHDAARKEKISTDDWDWRPAESKLPADVDWVEELHVMSKLELLFEMEKVQGVVKGLCIGLDAILKTGSHGVCEELLYELLEKSNGSLSDKHICEWYEQELDAEH